MARTSIRTVISALALCMVSGAVAPADMQPTYTGPESPSEKRFVATIQQGLMRRFPRASDAERAGYVRYTDVDETGAISYANCHWSSQDPAHPSQLWYDRRGNLLGADFSVPLAVSSARPRRWGVNPGRWSQLDGHEHWVVRDPKTGQLAYEKYIKDPQFAAAGGNVNNPSAQTLVALHKVASTSDVVHLFHFPALWDLTVWVKPNPNGAFADENPTVSAGPSARDGRHDFDFEFGRWRVTVAQRLNPLSARAEWTHYQGTHVVYPIWNGRANYGVMELDGPRGHIEGMQTRLYDPSHAQWDLRFASSSDGALGSPSVGAFQNGRGTFYSRDMMAGRRVTVRSTTSGVTKDSYRDDIALSADGGKTWIEYWTARYTRAPNAPVDPPPNVATGQQRGFDFEFGSWKAKISRLLHPLTGSHQWTTYTGISVVHKIWNGRANLGEIDLNGPAGHLGGLSLRLYSPQTRKWSVYWANANGGLITTPLVGGFAGHRGLFMDRETFDNRPILARFVFTFSLPKKFQIVQAFSPDDGKSWESNWIATFTR